MLSTITRCPAIFNEKIGPAYGNVIIKTLAREIGKTHRTLLSTRRIVAMAGQEPEVDSQGTEDLLGLGEGSIYTLGLSKVIRRGREQE